MNKHFEETLRRIEIATGIRTMTEVAKIVGTAQQYVSKKSREGEFPVTWAYAVAEKYGISTDWIMTGKGPKKLEERPKSRKFELLDEFEEWLSEEVRRDPKRKDWFELQLLDSFSAFSKWKQKREEEEGGGYEFPASKVA